jgi:small subunit ribosomal protein S14
LVVWSSGAGLLLAARTAALRLKIQIVMAKISKVVKNQRRREKVALYKTRRLAAKKIINNPKSSPEEVDAAVIKLQKMPRDASPSRVRNRCSQSGRSRGFLRKFGVSRIALRELALEGQIPGVVKSSW